MSAGSAQVRIRVDFRAFARSMRQAARQVHTVQVRLLRPQVRRAHRRRCPTCTPFANPRPLSVNGHAYHRRTRARRGARRR